MLPGRREVSQGDREPQAPVRRTPARAASHRGGRPDAEPRAGQGASDTGHPHACAQIARPHPSDHRRPLEHRADTGWAAAQPARAVEMGTTAASTPIALSHLSSEQLAAEVERLRLRLHEAEDTLQAIRDHEVDAFVVSGKHDKEVLVLGHCPPPLSPAPRGDAPGSGHPLPRRHGTVCQPAGGGDARRPDRRHRGRTV